MLEFSIITISAFVSVLNELTKTISKNCFGKSINRYIPIFSLVYGVTLAICGYFIPDVFFGNNIVEAIFIGLSAGGAAVGIHQTFHQLSKPSESLSEDVPSEEASSEDCDIDIDENTEDHSTDDPEE